MNAGNHDVAIDFSNLFMDDSSLGSPSTCRSTRAPENRSRHKDTELDKLYDEHLRERDTEKRKALIRAFEKRAVRAGLSAAAAVVAPHRADPQDGDGLEDVAEPQSRRRSSTDVWLEYVRPEPRSRALSPLRRGEGTDHTQAIDDAPLHPPPHAADDPDAARGGGARVLHAARRAGRRRSR